MKTASNRFSNVIKEGVTPALKEAGFKKQGSNFYKTIDEISHTLTIQKDKWNTKTEIKFTLNIGVFSNKYWLSELDHEGIGELPKTPYEHASVIRKRIGELKYGKDHWYTIESQKLEYALIKEIKKDIDEYILPFLNKITDANKIIQYLKDNQRVSGNEWKLFIMMAEEDRIDEAKFIYDHMKNITLNKQHLKSIIDKGIKYNIEKSR